MNAQALASPALIASSPARAPAEWSTVAVLWKRELKRVVRQRSRLVGALGQPLIFWVVIGGGFAGTFRLPGSGVGYLEYFFPGVVAMVVLFTSIFGAMSLIEDRREGFLQAVLAGPGSRTSVALGKILGGATVAFLQAAAFALLAPLSGFTLARIAWLPLFAILALSSVGLAALGFALAWIVESTQGYHAVVSLLLVPLWVVSGAMFPATGPVLSSLMRADPVAYAVDGVRFALYGLAAPSSATLGVSFAADLAVTAAFALGATVLAALVCRRR